MFFFSTMHFLQLLINILFLYCTLCYAHLGASIRASLLLHHHYFRLRVLCAILEKKE